MKQGSPSSESSDVMMAEHLGMAFIIDSGASSHVSVLTRNCFTTCGRQGQNVCRSVAKNDECHHCDEEGDVIVVTGPEGVCVVPAAHAPQSNGAHLSASKLSELGHSTAFDKTSAVVSCEVRSCPCVMTSKFVRSDSANDMSNSNANNNESVESDNVNDTESIK